MDTNTLISTGAAALIGAVLTGSVALYREVKKQNRQDETQDAEVGSALRGELLSWLKEARAAQKAAEKQLGVAEQRLREKLDELHATQRERDEALDALSKAREGLAESMQRITDLEIALKQSRRVASEEIESALLAAIAKRDAKK